MCCYIENLYSHISIFQVITVLSAWKEGDWTSPLIQETSSLLKRLAESSRYLTLRGGCHLGGEPKGHWLTIMSSHEARCKKLQTIYLFVLLNKKSSCQMNLFFSKTQILEVALKLSTSGNLGSFQCSAKVLPNSKTIFNFITMVNNQS